MQVLIAIHHRVVAWAIPTTHVDELRRRFPHITFLHSRDRDSDLALATEADVAFALGLAKEATARATRLRWLHCSAHAVGQFSLVDLASRDITVTNSRGIQSTPIAEHVMACLLALARRLPLTLRRQEQHVWVPNELTGQASPWLIAGKTMGIVGLGTLGQAIATRAKAFGMRVIGMRRNPDRGVPAGVDHIVAPADGDRMLEMADVIVLAAPWTPGTDQILGAAAIAMMKRGALLINVARGQLVDESALEEALRSGRLGGAALDVFTTEPLPPDSAFWSMPNVIVTPHTSGFRTDHFDAVIDLFSENLRRFERGVNLLNVVDLQAGY
jgi:phosphoglycerate dehydrogenase-like enzyme